MGEMQPAPSIVRQRYLGEGAGDEYWMRRALDEAARGVGATSPNPPVGAVLVKDGRLLAKGFHAAAGQAHAELMALRSLASPSEAKGATLYVTLEPCSTQGRTPPCVEAIRAAGLSRVVYGSTDPNPSHAGRAKDLLEAAGLEVRAGVLTAECDALIRIFRHWITQRRSYVIAKAAMSWDGRLATGPGQDRWLTGPSARRDAQDMRREVEAILVGAETLRQDDPSLSLRHPWAPKGKELWRIILSRSGKLPSAARVFRDGMADRTIVLGEMDLADLPTLLAERGFTSVLIEGGGQILGQAFAARIVQEVHFYLAPRLVGGNPALVPLLSSSAFLAVGFRDLSIAKLGDDLKLRAYPTYG